MTGRLKRPAQAGNLGAAADRRPGGASSDPQHKTNPADCLAALADLAELRAQTDSSPKRRARHRRLTRYLAGRLARRALRLLGRARLDVRGAVKPA